jgi:hypothetical protein
MNLLHDPIDYTSAARKAWTYIPDTRRVRQAPNLGFNTPNGPGGLVTVDDTNGFNGTFERFSWELIGKKELYIPYHSYDFDDASLDFDTTLPVGHPNPDYMRYELHRVWVVEATLKEGQRHLYGKRVFYVDEDLGCSRLSTAMTTAEKFTGWGSLTRSTTTRSKAMSRGSRFSSTCSQATTWLLAISTPPASPS